jgi:outer membrane receptor protein involved in Fe transport
MSTLLTVTRKFFAIRLLLPLLLLPLLAAAFVAAPAAHGQTSGTISGVVTDSGGALVSKVTVMATNTTTGESRTSVTNAAGEFSFPALQPGDYLLKFAGEGFATETETATLNVTEHIAVNAQMQIASSSTTVEVSSQAPLLQTESITQGSVIGGEEIRDLPLATNNFTQLLALSPGVLAPLNDATSLGRGTQNVNVNGARTSSNSVYVDGIDAVNVHTNSSANNSFASNSVIIPPPDAIQELKIQTALFDATTGRSGGSNIALITRSGTNAFHGDVYDFFRNTDLNANNYFLKQQGQQRPELNQNQFGGSVAGPIVHDKAFFFFNYQGTRQRNGYSGITSIQLPQIPQTRTYAALGAWASTLGATSHTGPAIAANGSNINPVAYALLNLKFPNGNYVVPSPQTANTTGVNYAVSTPSSFNEDEYTGGAQWQIRPSDLIAFHAIVAEQPQFQAVASTRFLEGFGLNQNFKSRLYSIGETHIFSPNIVNEFHFGLNRALGVTGFQNQLPLSAIGMSRFNSSVFSDIPEIELSGSAELGYTISTDQADTENTFQYFDTLNWLKGKHNMAFGAEMRRYQDNYHSNTAMRGSLDFISVQNLLLGLSGAPLSQGGNGTGYSDIYEANVASGIVQRYDRLRDIGLFAQDSWKASKRLTLNLGLRWEYIGLPVDILGRNGAFDPRHYVAPVGVQPTSVGFVQEGNARNPVPGIAKVSNTLTDTVGKLNFAPRVGAAYQLNSQMVLRGGYGIFYDRLSNQLGLLESLSLPNYEDSTQVNSGGANALNVAGSLANPFPALPLPSQFPILPQLFNPANISPASPQVGVGIFNVDPQIRTPYYQQYGLNIETAFTHALMFELGYTGARGLHLPAEIEADQAQLASPTAPVYGQTADNTTTANSAQARAPYLGFSNSGYLFLQTNQTSNFNSLQATLTERLGTAQMVASYMWSKSLDTSSGAADGTVFNTTSGDQTNPRQAWGPSDFDRTNHFTLRFVQPVPHAKFRWARGNVGSRVFNGYRLEGAVVLQSGTPFTITNSGGAAYYGTNTSRASFAVGANNNTAKLSGKTENRLNAYFNTAAFTGSGNLYGNVGRNFLRGPFERVADISMTKETQIHDNLAMEFRAQAFNITNTANFANPASDEGTASTFGVISAVVGNPRVLQFVLKFEF